jgi:undecaprenyl-diphosphatase
MEAILSLDQKLFYWLNVRLNIPWLDWFMIFATRISDKGLFWFFIVLILFLNHRRLGGIRPALLLFTGIGIGGVVENIVKAIVARPRPPMVEEHIHHLIDLPISYSFPSGHAVSSFVSMYILYQLFPKTIRWALPCAVLMAYSRIYVGVHYPLDVIAGGVIGIAAGKVTMHLPIMAIAHKVFSRIPFARKYLEPTTADTVSENLPVKPTLSSEIKERHL